VMGADSSSMRNGRAAAHCAERSSLHAVFDVHIPYTLHPVCGYGLLADLIMAVKNCWAASCAVLMVGCWQPAALSCTRVALHTGPQQQSMSRAGFSAQEPSRRPCAHDFRVGRAPVHPVARLHTATIGCADRAPSTERAS
jgi:hypothetical protein